MLYNIIINKSYALNSFRLCMFDFDFIITTKIEKKNPKNQLIKIDIFLAHVTIRLKKWTYYHNFYYIIIYY